MGPQLALSLHPLAALDRAPLAVVQIAFQRSHDMSKYVFAAKLGLFLLVLASLAVALGDLPWGPN